ncbi:putative membrane protein [Andreprevotia lacus DSM 23236]|jgi:putative membrane protein|uniref:Putative membrane protein n=1 Tax=Andreprevotia lacus DSM 23236 TaxID=1121001 RepID=A0A1W1XRI3_9NEIS|nr:DUF350 domain-containing protein [Andreprevotia lacus]SMC26462.1 putative membrane protein [Andreprevotia lacus DSM 23236]
MLQQLYAYLIYLMTIFALLAVFAVVYCKVTPIDELGLIRQGKVAAALSFGGALLGFTLTLAATAIYHASYLPFLAWAGGAMVVQLLAYLVLSHVIRGMNEALEQNNVAMGALIGTVALVVGIANAACLS